MPQFDFGFWLPQGFWAIATFALLCYVMIRTVVPRVSAVLEDREARINAGLRRAEQLKQEADDALAAYERTMADARAEASDLVRRVREQADAEAAARSAELNDRLTKQIAEAEARIARARSEALASVREVATAIAAAAVEKLTGRATDPGAVSAAVDTALSGGA